MAKRKKSKTAKAIKSQRKVPFGRQGQASSASQGRRPARLAWLDPSVVVALVRAAELLT